MSSEYTRKGGECRLQKKMWLEFPCSINDIVERNKSFDACTLRVMYTGKNRNRTSISKEAVEKAIPTLYNCPIVCNYDVEEDKWTRVDKRVGKSAICADPYTHSLVIIKKQAKFCMYDVESKEETLLPTPPRGLNLGSNQETLFIRTGSDEFIFIANLDSHSLHAYISKTKKWVQLRWRDPRNGSSHLVFDPITSAFYYKIDGESSWFSAPVKMD